MSRPLRVGLSTCPNDTFLFHALLTGVVEPRGLELEFVLADVEELNERMLAGELELSKVSAHALLELAPRVWLLPSGSALGFGVGPLLLARPGLAPDLPLAPRARVLAPGRHTTATLLYRLLARELGVDGSQALAQTVFSEILPRLADGGADYGVCIHEARFTWQSRSLGLVADLGELFERTSGGALPLGGLCAARSLGRATAEELARLVRRSLEWALAHRAECLPTLRAHAQEHSDEVLWAHVDLYVNDWTLELGTTGRAAYGALARLAHERGLVGACELELI
jgi:5,8-dihydroxy-2-naphthoate synthase